MTISGSATTDALRLEAVRLHNLDAELQQLKFYVDGMKLPAGIAISESVLADTKDVEVTVVGKQRVVTNEGPTLDGLAASLLEAAAPAAGNSRMAARPMGPTHGGARRARCRDRADSFRGLRV